jgi:hypothetical protein
MERTILPERRLLAAVLALAVEDARRAPEPHRTEARLWLRSAACQGVCVVLDLDYGAVHRWLAQLDP